MNNEYNEWTRLNIGYNSMNTMKFYVNLFANCGLISKLSQ